ncbi:MAG TPA: hypothetical protein VKB93_08260, partial [Thermoanaerobaculia bacterium]|nr:hypothetical protein [Thermoanaerobaculia bacterium]
RLAVLLLFAASLRADVVMSWVPANGTILVAHGGKIEAFDPSGGQRRWSAKGLANPSAIVVTADGKGAAVLDGYADRVAIVSVAEGLVRFQNTPTTPVAAAFFGHDLWVVLRDTSRVRRITEIGDSTDVAVALDPAFVAVSDMFVYVYSRAEGLLQEIDAKSAQITRSVSLGIAGSDLEIKLPQPHEPLGAKAYVCLPTGKLAVIDLVKMQTYEAKVGTGLTDLAFIPFSAGLSWVDGTAVIADPGKAAIYASTNIGRSIPITTPAPVDRIAISSAGVFALDSAGGTLYRVEGRSVTPFATGVTPTSFVATNSGLFLWDAANGVPRRAP